MEQITSEELKEALILWSGKGMGRKPYPSRDDYLVLKKYGIKGPLLLERIQELLEDFYKTNANVRAHDLIEMGDIAIKDFEKLHPDLCPEIAEIFARDYTWNFK